jgi:exonuclease III
MKGLFLNVRGLGKKSVAPYIREMMALNSFDFVCLQETMMHNLSDSNLRKLDRSMTYLWDWIPAKDKSGGVLSVFKIDKFDVGKRSQGNFVLQHNMWDKKVEVKLNILNVYGAIQSEQNKKFLAELASFYSQNKDPYTVGGDFNIVNFSSKKTETLTLTYSLKSSMPSS